MNFTSVNRDAGKAMLQATGSEPGASEQCKKQNSSRIQLERRGGWRKPLNAVKVDRNTRWGNPMRVRPGYPVAQAMQDYRYWLAGNSIARLLDISATSPTLKDIRLRLGGKNLACWSRIGDPCHADVLLRLANAEEGLGSTVILR